MTPATTLKHRALNGSRSPMSDQQLRRNQFHRACDLMECLNKMVVTFTSDTPPRLHADQASKAILDWLAREYSLGREAERRRHV